MPNPSGPDRDNTSDSGDRGAAGDPVESQAHTAVEPAAGADEKTTEGYRAADPATEVIGPPGQQQQPPIPQLQPGERRFTAPGFDAKDIRIAALPDALIVEGEAEHEHRSMEGNVRVSEFGERKLFRHIPLPEPVDVDHVSATLDKGLLRLRAAKAHHGGSRAAA